MTRADAEPNRMDLTSMIDVVFLLIVFFVLVSEMAQAELEHLQLPEATQCVPDVDRARRRMILNVSADGMVVYRRATLAGDALVRAIRLEASLQPDPDHLGLSRLPLLIRGDRRANYGAVQQILQACAKCGVWKVELAAVMPATQDARR